MQTEGPPQDSTCRSTVYNPHRAGEQVLGAAIALFAIAGLATQAVAIGTGRDFVFGAIPKLHPLGTRNLQVWFGSVMFICCAVAAVIAAVNVRTRRGGSGIGWWIAAGSLALLSVERMASISNLVFPAGWGDVAHPEVYLALITGTCAFVTLVSAERVLPPEARRRLGWSTLAFLLGAVAFGEAVGQTPDSTATRITHVVLATAGRVLELAGLAMFLVTVLALVARDGATLRAGVPLQWPSARSIGRSLNALTLVMLTASLVAVWARWSFGPQAEPAYRFLFVDFEGNLPTWVSSALLFGCGVVAAVQAVARRQARDRHWIWWLVLGVFFAALSADEAASLHELLVFPLRRLLGGSAWLRYPLILPGLVVVTATAVLFRRFVIALPRETRRALVSGGTIFFTGALGVETLGGWFDPELYGDNVPYVVLATIEEGLEFLGVSVVLVGLLRHVESEALAPGHTSGSIDSSR